SGRGSRVVGRAERRLADETAVDGPPRGGVDAGDLERLRGGEGRKDGRETPGEHRLAGARRADEEEVVTPRGRHLERSARERETADLAQVERLVVERVVGRDARLGQVRPRRPLLLALQAGA